MLTAFTAAAQVYREEMFVVLVNYTAPIQEIDYVLPDHAEWLAKQYERGNFLVSGRRELHSGGVIIAKPMSRGRLDAILATDPFALQHLVHYEVIEFSATKTAYELRAVNEAVAH